MGGRLKSAFGNVAEEMAALDRGGVADRGEHRRVDGLRGREPVYAVEEL